MEKSFQERSSVQLLAGCQSYVGDLLPDNQFVYNAFGSGAQLSLCGAAGWSYAINRIWSVDARLFVARLKGDETQGYGSQEAAQQWHAARGVQFKTLYSDLSVSACLEPLYLFQAYRSREATARVSPYIRAGVGYGFARVTRENLATTTQYATAAGEPNYLQRDLSKGSNISTVVIPVGAGVKIALSPKTSLLGEINRRFTLTDYLDGTGNWNAGNRNDGIMSYTLGISYSLSMPTYWNR
jgi:hypothetical protein